MKYLKYLTIIFLAISVTTAAAQVDVGAYGGWTLGGKSGNANIKNDWNYGAFLDYTIQPGLKAELFYNRMESVLEIRDVAGFKQDLGSMSVEYFQIGVMKELPMDQLAPFTLVTVGATRFAPKESGIKDDWRFSITLGLGANYHVTEKIGLRAGGRLLLPMFWGGGGFYCGTGGCGVGLGSRATFIQVDLSAGLFISL
jgi:opacity protein-like surface antigen